jgi:hypothetical protein
MHTSPPPAHPSYRLITALRLYHTLRPQETNIPSSSILEWKDATLGKREVISEDNERLWRECLINICEEIVARAAEGLSKTRKINSMDSKGVIEKLWEEERYVAIEVMKSLQLNTKF